MDEGVPGGRDQEGGEEGCLTDVCGLLGQKGPQKGVLSKGAIISLGIYTGFNQSKSFCTEP